MEVKLGRGSGCSVSGKVFNVIIFYYTSLASSQQVHTSLSRRILTLSLVSPIGMVLGHFL